MICFKEESHQKEVFWINAVKSICLLSVYMIYSDIYYCQGSFPYDRIFFAILC